VKEEREEGKEDSEIGGKGDREKKVNREQWKKKMEKKKEVEKAEEEKQREVIMLSCHLHNHVVQKSVHEADVS
jgi:hypothetical protein